MRLNSRKKVISHSKLQNETEKIFSVKDWWELKRDFIKKDCFITFIIQSKTINTLKKRLKILKKEIRNFSRDLNIKFCIFVNNHDEIDDITSFKLNEYYKDVIFSEKK